MKEFLLWWKDFREKYCYRIRTTVSISDPFYGVKFRFEKDVEVFGTNRSAAIDFLMPTEDFSDEVGRTWAERVLLDCVRRLHQETAQIAREGKIPNES